MPEKSIIVIGGGLAGLATGVYAQRNGYRTRIFELHTQPGGVCTAWTRRGYTIDGCIHWLMGAKPGMAMHRIYREVGALDGAALIPKTHYLRFIDQASGQQLDITADADRLARDMKAISPADASRIDQFVNGARALSRLDLAPDQPPELLGVLGFAAFFWRARRLMRYFFTHAMPVADFANGFRSAFLRNVIANSFLPQMPVYGLFVMLGDLFRGGQAIPIGGSLKFAQAIANRYLALGGEISYRSPVEEILVENGQAVGVRLGDGATHRADAVVSAADGHSTIFDMLGGRFADAKTRERYETWPLFPGILLVTFGVARDFAGAPATLSIFTPRPIAAGGGDAAHFSLRLSNYDPMLAPAGKTVAQAIVQTDFDYWWKLKDDRAAYEARKAEIAREVLANLEPLFPGVAAQVEMTDVATPATFVRFTRNYRGAFEGWLMTPHAFRTHIPKTLPGLANFHMAGQWVEPGGGVPTAICSGRQVVQLLCHGDGKAFRAED